MRAAHHTPMITKSTVASVTSGSTSVNAKEIATNTSCEAYDHAPRVPWMYPCSSSGKRSRYACRGIVESSVVANRIAPVATETTHT